MNLDTPLPDLQILFFERLATLRSVLLLEALRTAVGELDISSVDGELSHFAAAPALQRVAGWGLRGETVFAVPCVLKAAPQLIGYYRLLLGFSQKQFYGKATGFGRYKSMEENAHLTVWQASHLTDLCMALCGSAEYFVNAVPGLSAKSVHELTLLTLGPQLRGGALNRIGQAATRQVFGLIQGLVKTSTSASTDSSIEIESASGEPVRIAFATDPDIAIHAELPSGSLRPIVAIEIKGGRDVSNVHNRIGEAEKSHQKARQKGFTECWTIIGVPDLDIKKARQESPSTDRFFSLDEITDPTSDGSRDFEEQLLSRLGLRV